MRKVRVGPATAILAMLLRTGEAQAQANGQGVVVRPPRHGVSELYRTPETTTYGVLDEMASRASVIFVGSVTSVRWLGGDDAAASVVAIEFTIEDGIRGPASGTTYVLREWAGLWRDAARYRVGERRLMLLHAPGPGGLSSPVDGLDGAIPVTGQGATPVASTQTASTAPPLPVIRADLRWVQARQMRTVALAPDPAAGPRVRMGPSVLDGRASGPVAGEQLPLAGEPLPVAAEPLPVAAEPLPPPENPPLTEVVGRLRAGEAPRDAAR